MNVAILLAKAFHLVGTMARVIELFQAINLILDKADEIGKLSKKLYDRIIRFIHSVINKIKSTWMSRFSLI